MAKGSAGLSREGGYRNPSGIVEHAELVLGNGMVMIGTFGHVQSSAPWFVQPHATGAVTASVYVIVPDCQPVYASAKAAGAEFLQDMELKSYGGKSFIVRDPEGQIWSLGEYDPWSSNVAS